MPTKTAPKDTGAIARAAQRESVAVPAEGDAAFGAISPGEFDLVDELDRTRREAKDELMEVVARMQAYAASRGLTEAELERLLADED